MKAVTSIFLCGLLLGFMTIPSFAQNTQNKKPTKAERQAAQTQKVKNWVDKRTIKIEIDRILPASGRSRNSSDGYTLTIYGDTLNCYLPYFGQAYSAPFGSDEAGVVVKKKIIKIEQTFSEKKGYELKFEAPGEGNELFTFFVSITLSGNCSINVNSTNRQYISYQGELQEPPLKKQ